MLLSKLIVFHEFSKQKKINNNISNQPVFFILSQYDDKMAGQNYLGCIDRSYANKEWNINLENKSQKKLAKKIRHKSQSLIDYIGSVIAND